MGSLENPSMLSQLDETMFDGDDYRLLLFHVFRQALDDYVKLQHPKQRSRTYLQEALDAAVDMFFDSEYSMLSIEDPEGRPLTLKRMVQEMLDDDRVDLNLIKSHVVEQAYKHWENKTINVLFIPDSFVFQGHVYNVHHVEDEDWSIDFDEKIISIDKTSSTENQERFMQAVMQILFYHEDIPMARAKLDRLGKGLFQALRMNSCFIGA
jgi:hypothetical protein